MIELKFGIQSLKILIFNIVKNQTSTFKCKKVLLHNGGIKGRMASREMLLILKFGRIGGQYFHEWCPYV